MSDNVIIEGTVDQISIHNEESWYWIITNTEEVVWISPTSARNRVERSSNGLLYLYPLNGTSSAQETLYAGCKVVAYVPARTDENDVPIAIAWAFAPETREDRTKTDRLPMQLPSYGAARQNVPAPSSTAPKVTSGRNEQQGGAAAQEKAHPKQKRPRGGRRERARRERQAQRTQPEAAPAHAPATALPISTAPHVREEEAQQDPLSTALATAVALLAQLAQHARVTEKVHTASQALGAQCTAVLNSVSEIGKFVPLDQLLAQKENGPRSLAELLPANGNRFVSFVYKNKLCALRDQFALLDLFIRAGQDPQKAAIFGAEGIRIARLFADEHTDLKGWLRKVPPAVSKRQPVRYSVNRRFFPKLVQVLKQLHTAGILVETPTVRTMENNAERMMVECSIVDDNEVRDLMQGHWLSAFARWLIDDHTNRNRIPAELISRLTVEVSRAETGTRSGVEYDVLAHLRLPKRGDTVVAVECKSGNVSQIKAQDIITAQQLLQGVVNRANGTCTLEYICLVLDVFTQHDKVAEPKLRAELAKHNIRLITVSQLREYVHSLL